MAVAGSLPVGREHPAPRTGTSTTLAPRRRSGQDSAHLAPRNHGSRGQASNGDGRRAAVKDSDRDERWCGARGWDGRAQGALLQKHLVWERAARATAVIGRARMRSSNNSQAVDDKQGY